MPTLRDWLEAIAFLIAFFTALAASDPAASADFTSIGQERTMNRYLTDQEQARLLTVLKERSGDATVARDYAWIRALRHSGLRINEFSLIDVGDALSALRTGYLFVPREHRKGWNRKDDADKQSAAPKRRPPKDLQVYLTNALREAIEDLLKIRMLGVGDAGCHEDDALVISRNGSRLGVRSYQQRLTYWAEQAGLPPGVSPHWLRHTRAMNIMQHSTARDPRGVVQAALGHVDIRSSGVYTGTPREQVESALDEIDTIKPHRITRAMLRRAYEGRASA